MYCHKEEDPPSMKIFFRTILSDKELKNYMWLVKNTLSFLHVTIKQSKTDPFHCRVNSYLRCTHIDLCLVAAILSYLTQSWGRIQPAQHSSPSLITI